MATLQHRTPVVIDATSGQHLGDLTEQAAAGAARHLTVKETADRAGAGPREQQLLDHVFGNLEPARPGIAGPSWDSGVPQRRHSARRGSCGSRRRSRPVTSDGATSPR